MGAEAGSYIRTDLSDTPIEHSPVYETDAGGDIDSRSQQGGVSSYVTGPDGDSGVRCITVDLEQGALSILGLLGPRGRDRADLSSECH